MPETDTPQKPNPEVVDPPVLVDPDRDVTLVPFGPEFASIRQRVIEACQDADSQRNIPLPRPYLPEHADGWHAGQLAKMAAGEQSSWWIRHRGQYAGAIDLIQRSVGAEIGCILHPDARGHGVMAAATRLVCDWGFGTLDLPQIVWRAVVGNRPSVQVAQACGFRFGGPVRDLIEHGDRRRDGYFGSLRPDEPRRVRVQRLPELPLAPTEAAGQGSGARHEHGSAELLHRGRLRRFAPADAPQVTAAFADPVTRHWFAEAHEDADAFWRWCEAGELAGTTFTWAIDDPEQPGTCAGGITLFGVDDPAGLGELGYWVTPDARGRGLATAAVRTVAEAVLTDTAGLPGRECLQIRCVPENAASVAVARTAGFSHAGRIPRAERLGDGTMADVLVLARTR